MEQKTKKLNFKIIISIVVAIGIIAVIGILVFKSNISTTSQMTKEEMLQVAEEKKGTYFQELGQNTALAENQINRIFKISGVTYNIGKDNVEIVVGDDTICKVYLTREDLITLNKNQDITIVGQLSSFNVKNLILTKLAYFEFKSGYIIETGAVH